MPVIFKIVYILPEGVKLCGARPLSARDRPTIFARLSAPCVSVGLFPCPQQPQADAWGFVHHSTAAFKGIRSHR
jgi:hypothetical protein